MSRTCSFETCDRPYVAKGYCGMHYQRVTKYHIPLDAPLRPIRGDQNPNWKGGIIGDGNGRVLIYSPNHPRPSWGGMYVYRYRLVMEEHLGRVLGKDEIVHHINGIKDDDRLENLCVMSQSDHIKIHRKDLV
jgi:hypothetical protein